MVGQAVRNNGRSARLLGFRCSQRGLVGDTASGCANADGACRLQYDDNGSKYNQPSFNVTFLPNTGPAAAAATAVCPAGSPLWVAAVAGHAKIVEYLLAAGASPESPGPGGSQTAAAAQGADPVVAALFYGVEFWRASPLWQARQQIDLLGQATADSIPHTGVSCDRSGTTPILGPRYEKIGFDFNLCAAEHAKLSAAEKDLFVLVDRPAPLLFSDLEQLCTSLGRQDVLLVGTCASPGRPSWCVRANGWHGRARCWTRPQRSATPHRTCSSVWRLLLPSTARHLRGWSSKCGKKANLTAVARAKLEWLAAQLQPAGARAASQLIRAAGLGRTVECVLAAAERAGAELSGLQVGGGGGRGGGGCCRGRHGGVAVLGQPVGELRPASDSGAGGGLSGWIRGHLYAWPVGILGRLDDARANQHLLWHAPTAPAGRSPTCRHGNGWDLPVGPAGALGRRVARLTGSAAAGLEPRPGARKRPGFP